jgi:hypothetical protein
MDKIHILIVDESPDLANSLGNLIMDVFGTKMAEVQYAYNIQDGLNVASQTEFHFIFMRVNISSGNAAETRLLFKEVSLNPSAKIITLSFNSEFGFNKQTVETEGEKFLNKEEVDVDDLAFIFEKMR